MKSSYLVCSNLTSNETLESLHKSNFLNGVIIDDFNNSRNQFIIDYCTNNNIELTDDLEKLFDIKVDIIFVSNYPKLIPVKYLNKHNIINTHWSDLPKYRGIHSTAWAILNNEEKVAVTFHIMEEEFDTGDIVHKGYVDILDKGLLDIHQELRILQANISVKIMKEYSSFSDLPRIPQNEKEATYVPKRLPKDGKIDWTNSSQFIYSLYRILPYPDYPPPFCFLENKKVEIIEMQKVNIPSYFCKPGTVVRSLKNGSVWIKTSDTVVCVNKIKIDNEILNANKILKRGFVMS